MNVGAVPARWALKASDDLEPEVVAEMNKAMEVRGGLCEQSTTASYDARPLQSLLSGTLHDT